MENFPLWSTTLFPHFDARTQSWVIAFEEDGIYYTDFNPEADIFAPVPDTYATEAGAAAAIAVLVAWEAPVANDLEVVAYPALHATPEWAALLPHLPGATIGSFTAADFADAADMEMVGGLPGTAAHYAALVAAGVKVVA